MRIAVVDLMVVKTRFSVETMVFTCSGCGSHLPLVAALGMDAPPPHLPQDLPIHHKPCVWYRVLFSDRRQGSEEGLRLRCGRAGGCSREGVTHEREDNGGHKREMCDGETGQQETTIEVHKSSSSSSQ